VPLITGIGHETDITIADFVADRRAPTPSAAAELAVPDQFDLASRLNQTANKLLSMVRYRLHATGNQLLQLEKRLPDPVRRLQVIGQRLDDITQRGQQAVRIILSEFRQNLLRATARLQALNPAQVISINKERTRNLAGRLRLGMSGILQRRHTDLEHQAHALHTVSPLATLSRGYAIVTLDGTILRDTWSVQPGDKIKSRLARGSLYSQVTWIEED
jgi:exodeoxyribonuclease VII large subunit